jgi:hypothetical protein
MHSILGRRQTFPKPVARDRGNPYEAQFVIVGAILRTRAFGIAPRGEIPARIPTFTVPPRTCSDTKLEIDAKAEKKPHSIDSEELSLIDEWMAEPAPVVGNLKRFAPGEFDQDHNANSHMNFTSSAEDIFVNNCGISPVKAMGIKKILGKIISTILTTPLKTCGLVAL